MSVQATSQTTSTNSRRPRAWWWGSGVPAVLAPCLTLLLLGLVWQVKAMSTPSLDRWLFPTPGQVTKAGLGEANTRAELTNALGETALIALAGLAIATVCGLLMAAAMIQSLWMEHALQPVAIVLQCTPLPVLAPLFGFWWGYGFTSRLLVCILIALFPIIVSTVDGMRTVEENQHDFLTIHHASRWTRFWRLQLPTALPSVFTGLRVAGTNAVIGAVVADAFFRRGPGGLGVLVDNYREQLRVDRAMAAALTAITLGAVVFGLITAVRALTVGKWAPRHWTTDRRAARA